MERERNDGPKKGRGELTPCRAGVALRARMYAATANACVESLHQYHKQGVITTRDYMNSISRLYAVIERVHALSDSVAAATSNSPLVCALIDIRRDLNTLVKMYGVYDMRVMLDYIISTSCDISRFMSEPDSVESRERTSAILKYFHPTWCETYALTASITTSEAVQPSNHFCIRRFDWREASDTKRRHYANAVIMHVHGATIRLYDAAKGRAYVFDGYFDNIHVRLCRDPYVHRCFGALNEAKRSKGKPSSVPSSAQINSIIDLLTLSDVMCHTKASFAEMVAKMLADLKKYKDYQISQVIMGFDKRSIWEKYDMIYAFLLDHECVYSSYMAYLLYDLLSIETIISLDTNEQRQIFDCFTYPMRVVFKGAMYETVNQTRRVVDMECEVVPYEQQICLMRCSDGVKQKAMSKLKEVRSKSDDSAQKAKQYLDGLLRIPFGFYYADDVTRYWKKNVEMFAGLLRSYRCVWTRARALGAPKTGSSATQTPISSPVDGTGAIDPTVFECDVERLTNVDVTVHVDTVAASYSSCIGRFLQRLVGDRLHRMSRESITASLSKINKITRSLWEKNRADGSAVRRLRHSGKNKDCIAKDITSLLLDCMRHHDATYHDLIRHLRIEMPSDFEHHNPYAIVRSIKENTAHVREYMASVEEIFDASVYGQDEAKVQMRRIIAQWINGESSGRCIGFEGPPGCGKTSFAKNGVARCMRNADGTPRPFAFVPLGGSSNASFLEGHGYTYVGSTWGKIADILMDAKCMNPIIFVDELDKVSRTEHGKEINGILTHLIDTTQNDEFYDKYFSGVPLDLSRVLFIFSYNDPSLIDKIVLDRIHRINFHSLSTEDKVEIARRHLVPTILAETGMVGYVSFADDALACIIKRYTRESGVRRFKELLYEIIGEINLQYMSDAGASLPIVVGARDVCEIYLVEKHVFQANIPSSSPMVGIVNGLWANSLKEGGVLPIEVSLFPTETFLEFKLTGMQGDVMKESMNVAKTVVWSVLLTDAERSRICESCKTTRMQGIHVHCPEGATPKDGPSAGMAITLALYSALLGQITEGGGAGVRVREMVAMTGEINLRGEIGEIGGLDSKFLGGLNVGIREFVYPRANQHDYEVFASKYKGTYDSAAITFRGVGHIQDLIDGMLV